MKLQLTNKEIYQIAELLQRFPLDSTIYIPVAFNFYIQKNIKAIEALRAEIDEMRYKIFAHYGKQENGQLIIPQPSIQIVNEELYNLEKIEQTIEIYAIPLFAFNEIKLSTGQLQSLMFMIVGDNELEQRLLVEDIANYERKIPINILDKKEI